MNKEVSRKITLMQMFLSILIVTYHMTIVYSLKVSYSGDFDAALTFKSYTLYDLFAAVSLGLFFMISGVLHYLNLNSENLWQKVRSRFISLAVPFVIWNFISVVFFYMTGTLRYYGFNYLML